MSGYKFATKGKEVEIHHAEWYSIASLLEDMTNAILAPQRNKEILLAGILEGHFLADEGYSKSGWVDEFNQAMEYEGDGFLEVDEEPIDVSDLRTNTALAMGNEALKVATLLHANSYDGAFVRGKNRAWMADAIENDTAGLFRPGYGWENVVAMLRESAEETVFISYGTGRDAGDWAACSDWLDKETVARGMDPDDMETDIFAYTVLREQWEAMDIDEQWEIVETWMVKNADPKKEISPACLAPGFAYGDGMNAGKLLAVLEAKSGKNRVDFLG